MQDAAEEYEKLCQALSRMVDCLPQIEIYTDTFLDSEIVRACVGAFYISTLRFWTRACKFYRRHRLLNFIRVVWNDFDAEFGELEVNMIQNRERVESMPKTLHPIPDIILADCNSRRGCACRTHWAVKGLENTSTVGEPKTTRGPGFGSRKRDHSVAITSGIRCKILPE